MYYLKRWFYRKLFKILRKTPIDMNMVRYWKFKEAVQAKVTTNSDGATVMHMDGEDEPFPGFPRGHLLFGSLSKLKHEIKNQVFNWAWSQLESEIPHEEIIAHIKFLMTQGLKDIIELGKYDTVPFKKMNAPIKEIWRVLTEMESENPKLRLFKEALTFVLQEDDAYRFRMQWMSEIWQGKSPKYLEMALIEEENAEVVRDMKEKIVLLRRILLLILEDPKIKSLYDEFCRKINWSKLKLTEADKYHFRGKWFKVDTLYFEY